MRFCVGITLYNPTNDDIDNLKFYSTVFDNVFVYDNSDYHSTEGLENILSIHVISEGTNDGLGVACDKLCSIAKHEGFDYILLFDQDSRMTLENIERLIEATKHEDERIMLYCPQIVFNGTKDKSVEEYEFVDWCITSGTMIKLSIYESEIKFDEAYFIDRLDLDLCKQVNIRQGKICRINSAIMNQQLGESSDSGYPMHRPFRHYYIARNRLYYANKFGENKIKVFLQIVKHVYLVVRHEDEKMNKLKMIIRGMSDYKRGTMGKMDMH